jgi:hypothetical protein
MKPRQNVTFTEADVVQHRDVLGADATGLLLSALNKPTYRDIAAAHRLAVGTVKSRLSRARARLNELLKRAE